MFYVKNVYNLWSMEHYVEKLIYYNKNIKNEHKRRTITEETTWTNYLT